MATEMDGLPEDVRRSMQFMDAKCGVSGFWQTIRAELLRLAHENAELRADLHDADERSALRNHERTEATIRAERAESELAELKRKIAAMNDDTHNGGDEA